MHLITFSHYKIFATAESKLNVKKLGKPVPNIVLTQRYEGLYVEHTFLTHAPPLGGSKYWYWRQFSLMLSNFAPDKMQSRYKTVGIILKNFLFEFAYEKFMQNIYVYSRSFPYGNLFIFMPSCTYSAYFLKLYFHFIALAQLLLVVDYSLIN